jgi:hypothetical protein
MWLKSLCLIILFEMKCATLTHPFVDQLIPYGCSRTCIQAMTDSRGQDYPNFIEHWLTPGLIRLRGGGVKRIKKLTREQQAYVDAIKFPPALEKDIRRHWKKKPEYLQVPQDGGKIVKVRTTWVVQRMKEKALEKKKYMESLPMRLLDLGTKGVRWIREIPGQILGPLFAKKEDTTRYDTGPHLARSHDRKLTRSSL